MARVVRVKCSTCNGMGSTQRKEDGWRWERCSTCKGDGTVNVRI